MHCTLLPQFWALIFFLSASPIAVCAQGWFTYHNLTSTEYHAKFEDLAAKSYRPSWISGYTVKGEELFACVFKENTSGSAWKSKHGITSAQYAADFEKFTGEGYRLLLVNGYTAPDGLTSTIPSGRKGKGRRGSHIAA